MKSITVFLFWLVAAFSSALAQSRPENLFYMVDTPESFESFIKNVSQIDIVCPQTFLVSKEGVFTGSVDRRVLEIAKANKIR
ncbi:MAG: hypothetical protein IPH16_08690 [Haliscomenobacter sp.]|nr:hypothetical protein [Haliscomenobacter sp.]